YNWSCDVEGGNGDKDKLKVLDRWILARLTELVFELHKSFEKYDTFTIVKLLKEFIVNDFSTWYIRRTRDRISNNSDEIDRNVALSVMYGVLVTYSKLLAPVAPFIAEEMYKNLAFDESVHLTEYPKGDKTLLDEQLLTNMKKVREIVEKGHAVRKEANIKLRQPLAQATYFAKTKLAPELEQIIADELNVKAVEHQNGSDSELKVELDTKITQFLQTEGEARDLIRSIQQLRKDQNLTLKDRIEVAAPNWPKEFEELILRSTAAEKIEQAEQLSIKVINE